MSSEPKYWRDNIPTKKSEVAVYAGIKSAGFVLKAPKHFAGHCGQAVRSFKDVIQPATHVFDMDNKERFFLTSERA